MRIEDDCTYQEYKESVESAFNSWKRKPDIWVPKMCTTRLIREEPYPIVDTSEFLFILSIGEYEVRHDILEERVANGLGYHIYRYENMGKYKADLSAEEIAEIDKDVAYIKSKIKLPKIKIFDVNEW